jgi:hypothetical protein
MSYRPNIESASSTRTAATTASTHGDWSAAPKSLPERAAATPSAEYVVAMPST